MTQRVCNKREPAGVLRCELPFGHDKGFHPTMHESDGNSWGHNPLLRDAAPKRPAKRRAPIRKRSEDKIEDDARWAFIKECFIACHPVCGRCGQMMDNEWTLDLDHIVSRARGGKSVPSNAELLCRHLFDRNQGCHPAKHGVPMFGKTAS